MSELFPRESCTVCGTVENEDWATPSDGKSAKEEIATLLFACKCGGNEINDDDIDISRLRGSEDKASEILKGVCPKERTQDATSLDSSQDKQGKTNTTSSPENHREGSGNSTEESGGIPNFALQVQHQGWVKLFLPIWVGTVGIAYILGMLQA